MRLISRDFSKDGAGQVKLVAEHGMIPLHITVAYRWCQVHNGLALSERVLLHISSTKITSFSTASTTRATL